MSLKIIVITVTSLFFYGYVNAQIPQEENKNVSNIYQRRLDSLCNILHISYERTIKDLPNSSTDNAVLQKMFEYCPQYTQSPKLVATLTADVRVNSAKGGFAQIGENIELRAGKYAFRLASSTVRYGNQQKISETVLLRMNIETEYSYITLNGIGDIKTINVPTDCTLSIFFVPGEPSYDDSGNVKVEIFHNAN